MSIWDLANLNNPQVTDRVQAYGYMLYLSRVVKNGQRLAAIPMGCTAPVRVYCNHIASKRTVAQDKRRAAGKRK